MSLKSICIGLIAAGFVCSQEGGIQAQRIRDHVRYLSSDLLRLQDRRRRLRSLGDSDVEGDGIGGEDRSVGRCGGALCRRRVGGAAQAEGGLYRFGPASG